MQNRLLSFASALLVLTISLTTAAPAAICVYLSDSGAAVGVDIGASANVSQALQALPYPPPTGPQGQTLVSAFPPGTQLLSAVLSGEYAVVNFSGDLVSPDLDELRAEAIYEQVRSTLELNGVSASVRILCEGQPLYDYLPPSAPVAPAPYYEPPVQLAAGNLTGKKISLSPGHGLKWGGSSWSTDRPVYCAPLNQEDYHNLEMGIFLQTYLAAEGANLKLNRCTDKSFGNHSSGNAWWKMGPSYWLQSIGYPCSVYANSTGDCNLGTGASESNDNIRARGIAPNYDGAEMHIAIHTNGYQGDCTGAGCPTGSCTYYDNSASHADYGTVSKNLATFINNNVISSIRNDYPDASWSNRGVIDFAGGNYESRIPQCPAALIELGFHDSCDKDAVHLQDNFFRSVSMWAMYKGICDYYGVPATWDKYSCELVSHDIPATMSPGETRQIHVTIRNRGYLWNSVRGFKLGAVNDSDPFSASTRVALPSEVAPGETVTFTVNLTAPATPGAYTTDWRMLREGFTWFGPIVERQIAVTGTPDSEPPSIPQSLFVSTAGQTVLNLTWTASTDNLAVAGYRIYRNGSLLLSTGTTANTYRDEGCQPGTVYSYRVSAYDGFNNESGPSNIASGTTLPQTEYILDNTSAYFTGLWSLGTSSTDKYLDDYKYASNRTAPSATATWRPNIQRAGNYDVYVWYPQGANRSTQSPYTVVYNGGQVTVPVDQTTGGGAWVKIASALPFASGTGCYVQLNNGTPDPEATKNVMADAVRLVFINPYETAAPKINSVAVTPSLIVSGDTVQVVANVTDPAGIAAVIASGTPLTYAGSNNWSGQMAVSGATGSKTISIVARDNSWSYAWGQGAYTIGTVVRLNNYALHSDLALPAAAGKYLFSTWGYVSVIDANGFTLDDGAGMPVTVAAAGHGLASGDYALVRGVWSPGSQVLTSASNQIQRLN